MRITLAIGVLVALAVGCGSAASAPSPAANGASGQLATSLKVTFWPEGRGASVPETWTLRCDPAGGSLPKAVEACRRLGAMKQPFNRPRADRICTQVYGGPQQAAITGTFRGRRVLAQLAMNDGCQIARFKQLSFLVPGFSVAGGANS